MKKSRDYAVLVRPLQEDEGGGWIATVPDLPGCTSDGETMQEAIDHVQDAIEEWIDEAKQLGRKVPVPNKTLGQWSQRAPRSLHEVLKVLAQKEGVSFNQFVMSILSEYVGRRRAEMDLRPRRGESTEGMKEVA